MSAAFEWSEKKSAVAIELSQGKTQKEVTAATGVPERTIRSWLAAEEFSAEVDRLSLMVGIASRAERLRLAMRVIRQKIKPDGIIDTDRDLLDWLKFAQSETDGIKLDLTTISEAQASVAPGGQDRVPEKAAAERAPRRTSRGRKN